MLEKQQRGAVAVVDGEDRRNYGETCLLQIICDQIARVVIGACPDLYLTRDSCHSIPHSGDRSRACQL